MGALHNENVIGRNVIRFRHRKNWTQQELAAKMQLLGCCATCAVIADIEARRCSATEKDIMYFAEVFGVEAGEILQQNRPSKSNQ